MRFGPGFIARQNAYDFVNSEAETIINAFSTPPSEDRKELIDDTVGALKTAGIWSLATILHFPRAHTEQAARINWRDPTSYALTGGGTFTTDGGWATGSVSSSWTRSPTLGTGQNSFFFGAFYDVTWDNGFYIATFGPSGGEGNGGVVLRRDATTKIFRCNSNANSITAVANAGGAGANRMHYVRRGVSNQQVVGSIGTAGSETEVAAASTSTAPSTTASSFVGQGSVRFILGAANLSSAQIQAARNAFNNYVAGL